MSNIPPILWKASEEEKKSSHIARFMKWLEREKKIHTHDYASLHEWSIQDPPLFWRMLAEFTSLFSFPKDKVVYNDYKDDFIGVRWFEGVELNYAQMIFRNATNVHPAILFSDESDPEIRSLSWKEMHAQVSSLAHWMKSKDIRKGDRIASVLPNIPENVIAFLATQSIGAIWSSCSPDFGNAAILERFGQIEPKILFLSDHYSYNGKRYDKTSLNDELIQQLPSLKEAIILDRDIDHQKPDDSTPWEKIMETEGGVLQFEPLAFDQPIWILYSSGTTGKPKAITHSVGGNLIEHIKVLLLHWDVHPGERFFWYSTTGWMMWNFSIASMLVGATLVLYDGSPGYPGLERLWKMARDAKVNHFGVGAAYLISCQKAGLQFESDLFPNLRTIGATGSPLTPEAFDWVYRSVKKNVWLISFSGGTDVCSGFVGGCILLPVHKGEIQCRLLGCDLDAVDESGHSVTDELGEMVIRQPMPSMPLYFWNDTKNERYRSTYFEKFPGMWWHGDFITLTSRGTIIIAGRSDATLNRDGVRIGTAELYQVLDTVPGIADSLIVCLERKDGSFFMPLFVKMQDGFILNETIIAAIKSELRQRCSPRHVPDAIYAVHDIPYTISGKKMELPVKYILMGKSIRKLTGLDTLRNPESLSGFIVNETKDLEKNE
jgi:acetoacetyl-CoA synthetase